MAGLLAVDGGIDLDDLVVALDEARDLHGRAMRNFFVEVAQQLFAHDLTHDLTVGLVGGHAVREELGTFDGVLLEFVQQLVQPVARARGDGENAVEIIRLAVSGNNGEQVVLFCNGVDLVDAQNGGQARLPDLLDQLLLGDADVRHRLDEQSDEVHVRDGIARDLHHVVAQTAARLVKARGVEQDELRIALGHDAVDAVARGLRLIGDNGDLLADERVGQAGLADVRTSAEGDHGGFCLLHR